jgi:hypothetical protein
LTIAIVLTTAFLVYVALSTKSKHVALSGFDKAKYELHKYHAERYAMDATSSFFPGNSTPRESAYN